MTVPAVEPLGKVRTKIVATVGPASRDAVVLRALVEAGVDVFRLNFSHGTHADHTTSLHLIQEAADACGRIVAVLQDLGGPKIRLGPIPGDMIECRLGEIFTLVTERTSDDPRQLTCTYRDLPHDLKPGDAVLFADGAVAMEVIESGGGSAVSRVTLAGRLESRKGLNLPGATLNVEALTEKDLQDLAWTAGHAVDYVGLSFVRQASDVVRLRAELDRRGSKARIVAKIEKPQAVENLDAIITEADALMVARGDLGVEMDVERVPAIQKQVIAACWRARVPVITATQMLNSMETSNRPTRAEASDVFNAVLDGTDAVMLSGETAVGAYPIEAVTTMSRIVAEAEALMLSSQVPGWPASGPPVPRPFGEAQGHAGWVQPITEAVVESVRRVTRRLDAALVIVSTHSGRTAVALSKQRYAPATLALAGDPATARALALDWGVTPLLCPVIADPEKARAFAIEWARARGLVHTGDVVVIVQGTMPNNSSHNAMLVQVVE